MALPRVNAIVVGAGAAGGVVAKELATAGLSVVLLERGRWQSFQDHDHDELTSQRTSVLGSAFGPDDRRWRRVVRQGERWVQVLPSESAYQNNAACVGGGTFSYGAMAWRFMPQDFRLRTLYGDIPGSTLADWPISYDDLEPYYEKVEWEIGVSGSDEGNPFAPPRKRERPMPPKPYTAEGRLLYAAGLRLGLHPFPIPMLRNTVPYAGRQACVSCRYCVGFACEVGAKCGTHNTVIPVALASGNCELRTGCVAARVVTDQRGRATGVEYFDPEDRSQFQAADLVVLSASATETPRLMLNSKCKLFPAGLGNRNDWVGRNLQGHAYCGAYGLFERELYDDVGPGACISSMDFNHGNPGHIGGGILVNEFIRLPYLFTGIRPPGAARWGLEHKQFQRDWYKRSMGVKSAVQELPTFESRVEVDPEVKDYWGLPVARISGARHPRDRETGDFMTRQAERWLLEAGAIRTWRSLPGLGVSGGQHQAGTCRMGADPATSVVNQYGQVHDIDNLFVVDGSTQVNNGGFNPVLTIMAVAYRSAEYIARQWNGTRFRS
ncbi:GMC family oxidoreductase [bacterium]|nr:GMC family oxidoreductase [bacterium]